MLKLDLDRTPRWVDLPLGVRLLMRPAGTAEVHAYKTRSARLFNEMLEAYKTARDSGLPWDGSDLDDDMVRAGLIYALTLAAAARELVQDWEGVVDDLGAPLAFDRALLPRLMNIPVIADAFLDAVVAPTRTLAAEGNASGTSPNGSMATAPNTAKAAPRPKRAAAGRARSRSTRPAP
jgi:hypothetical protein